MQDRQPNAREWNILFGLSVAITVLFAALSLYARPFADDFCYDAFVRVRGVVGAQALIFQQMNGRLAANFISTVFYRLIDIDRFYAAVPLVYLMTFAGALFYAFAGLLSSRRQAGVAASAAIAFVLAVGDHHEESLYWWTGGATYWLPLIGIFAGFGVLMRVISDRYSRTFAASVLAVIAFTASGSNEVFSLALTGGLAALVVLALVGPGGKLVSVLLAATAASGAGTTIALTAPGLAVRRALELSDAPPLSIASALGDAAIWSAQATFAWLVNPGFIALALVVAVCLDFLNAKVRMVVGELATARLALILAALAVGVLFLTVLTYELGAGKPPYDRAAWIPFGTAMPLLVTAAAVALRAGLSQPLRQSPIIVRAGLVGFALMAILSPPVAQGVRDVWRGRAFAGEFENRQTIVSRALSDRARELRLPAWRSWLYNIQTHNDISTEPGQWRNVCFAIHSGIPAIAVAVGQERLPPSVVYSPPGMFDGPARQIYRERFGREAPVLPGR